MILVLADAHDAPANWLAVRLRAAGLAVVRLSPVQLVLARRIVHRLSDARSELSFDLPRGRLVAGALAGVINRMREVPLPHLAHAAPQDRDYAAAEWHAAFMGFLASLPCPVVNPPSSGSLCGPEPSPFELAQHATIAGLAQPELRLSAATGPSGAGVDPASGDEAPCWHVALSGRLFGPMVPAADRDRLLHVAHRIGAPLITLCSARHPGGRMLLAATSSGDLRAGGAALVAEVARMFRP